MLSAEHAVLLNNSAAGVVVSFAIIAFYKGQSLGSVELIYNRLHQYSQVSPVGGNKGGSFLTMWSIKGLLFGMLQVC